MKNKIIYLNERDVFPSRFDIARVRYVRGLVDDVQAYHRLMAGQLGEAMLVDYLRQYGCADWLLLPNVWLDYYGRFEGDLFLFTRRNYYVFEVKNYEGHFVYRDGNCWLNHLKLSQNAISQVRRAVTNLEGMSREARLSCKPQGVLAMVGANSWVSLEDTVDDLVVLNHGQIKAFVERLKREDQKGGRRIDFQPLLKVFRKYQIEDPFRSEMMDSAEFARVRKGICCERCSEFSVELSRKYVRCRCGFRESRESAIVRTICEYGVLNYERDLRVQEVLAFFGGDISRSNLVRVLQKHFEVVERRRYSYYKNKKLPYEQLEETFELDAGRRFYCKKEDILFVEK